LGSSFNDLRRFTCLSSFDRSLSGSKPVRQTRLYFAWAGRPGKYLANINTLARLMLAEDGVTRVSGGEHCTATEAGRFYSYRRDGVTGRQASLIWIRQ